MQNHQQQGQAAENKPETNYVWRKSLAAMPIRWDALRIVTKGLAGELLKRCESDGLIRLPRGDDPVRATYRALGVCPRERKAVKRAFAELESAGYLETVRLDEGDAEPEWGLWLKTPDAEFTFGRLQLPGRKGEPLPKNLRKGPGGGTGGGGLRLQVPASDHTSIAIDPADRPDAVLNREATAGQKAEQKSRVKYYDSEGQNPQSLSRVKYYDSEPIDASAQNHSANASATNVPESVQSPLKGMVQLGEIIEGRPGEERRQETSSHPTVAVNSTNCRSRANLPKVAPEKMRAALAELEAIRARNEARRQAALQEQGAVDHA